MQRLPVILLLALPLLTAAALPRTGPVPAPKPAIEDKRQDGTAAPGKTAEGPLSAPDDVPTPEPKPETDAPPPPSPTPDPPSAAQPDPSVPEESQPGAAPAPAEDVEPEKTEPDRDEGETDGPPKEETPSQGLGEPKEPPPPPPPPPPVAEEDPEALKACLTDLAALGTKYATAARIDDGRGCGIDQPLEVIEVLPGIDTGGAQMRCETARALAHWLKDTVKPALNIAMPGRRIAGLTTGSTYACRLRNGAAEGKISEHARGNAIDIAAFRLEDGTEITMKPRDEDGTMEGAFQRTATAGACLHFSTVLSPGSDAAHQDHLHLDVLERESGYRYCR